MSFMKLQSIINFFIYFYLRFIVKICTPKDLIIFACKRYASHTMITELGISYTYQCIYDRVIKLSHGLHRSGLLKGDTLIADINGNTKEFIEVRLASYLCGFIFCALPNDYTWQERLEIIHDMPNSFYITNKPYLQKNLLSIELIPVKKIILIVKNTLHIQGNTTLLYDQLFEHTCIDEISVTIKPHEISAIGYTSGTSGKSKGVVWTHEAWLYSFYNFLRNSRQITPNKITFLHVMPLSTSGSLSLLPLLAAGAHNIIIKKFSPHLVAECIDTYKVTTMVIAPSFFIELWDFFRLNTGKYTFKSLQSISVGSAYFPVDKLQRSIEEFGPIIHQSYGMAEVLAPLASLQIYNRHNEKAIVRSVGKPIPQIQLKIMSEHNKNQGILLIKSKTMCTGYIDKKTIIKHRNAEGYFITSDYVRIGSNRYLYIIERNSNIFTYQGITIIPRDIEEIIHTFPGVKEVAVLLCNNYLTAFVSVCHNCTIDVNELKLFCNKNIRNILVPQHFVFFKSLPHSASGKILRNTLLVHQSHSLNI